MPKKGAPLALSDYLLEVVPDKAREIEGYLRSHFIVQLKRTVGRPSKLTPEIHQKLVGYLKLGNFRKHAAQMEGLDPTTITNWVNLGKAGHPTYRQFALDVERAEAESIVLKVSRLATSDDERTMQWFLARKCPEEWGDKVQVELQVQLREKLGEILDVVEEVCGPELSLKILERLGKTSAG